MTGVCNIIPNTLLRLINLNINQKREMELFNTFINITHNIQTGLANRDINQKEIIKIFNIIIKDIKLEKISLIIIKPEFKAKLIKGYKKNNK